MQKIRENKLLNIIMCLIIGMSAGVFTTSISVTQNKVLIIISAIISMLFFIFMEYKNSYILRRFFEASLFSKICASYFSLRVLYEVIKNNKLFIISGLFLYLSLAIIVEIIYKSIKRFIDEMDVVERRYYLIVTTITVIIIATIYGLTDGFAKQYDVVYSIDSGYITNKIIPKLYYFDIRHVLLSTIMFPIGRLFRDIEVILGCKENLSMILWAVFNSQLLIIISILLKRMTKSKWIMIIYTVSNPFLLYFLMIEKYQLCTFFIVIFVYSVIKKKDIFSKNLMILSAGVMTTSAVWGLFCGETLKLKERIKEYFNVALTAVIYIIVLGRINVLTSGLTLVNSTMNKYGGKMGMKERFYSCLNMLSACLTAPNYIMTKKKFTWANGVENLNVLGIIILGFIIISFILCYKDRFAQICMYWVMFSFFLFIVLGWSVHESPLFVLYFSWAVISLIIMGLEKMFINNKCALKYIILLSSIVMISVNIPHMISLTRYLIERF